MDNNEVKADNDNKEINSNKSSKQYKFGTNDMANVKTTDYNFDGVNLTKNPQMSYFEAKTQYAESKDGRDIAKKMGGVPKGLEKLPPSFYNTVEYPHRQELHRQMNDGSISLYKDEDSKEQDDSGYFRLGCCEFKIPPEFITVSSTSGNNSIQTIRSSSSLITKNSFCDKEIVVNLVLNGMNQINGYKVESPFGYSHYIDGLRALLAQFKYTPFVPVKNVCLNIQYNIHTVALKNITVETIEGFPETLNVKLTLSEFNSIPYTQAPNWAFDECINWDLFNFYIQRNMMDKDIGLKKIETDHLTNKVKFKILKSEVLDKKDKEGNTDYEDDLKIDLLDDKYYEEEVDSVKHDLHMTKLTFATGNKLPKIQMPYYEAPTFQFLGGTDTEFVMQFETTNSEAIARIETMNSKNLALVRDYRYKNSIGFIKVENELINLTGTTHIVIGNVTTSTVPGFPGMYTVSISGVSFDAGQKDREKFKSFRPFYDSSNKKGDGWFKGRKGTRKDLLTQSKRGLANKVIQEAAVEAKLMCTELYPDLRLPKYSAVDWALGKIAKWRKDNGLESLPFTKMPRAKSHIPGKGEKDAEYNGFVDPDFYMMYPFQAGEMDVLNPPKQNSEKDKKQSSTKYSKQDYRTFSEKMIKDTSEQKVDAENIKASIINGLMDGTINPVSSLLVPDPAIDKVVEPDFVPGYEPDEQLRFHKGNLENKNSDEELIEKLNSWIKWSVSANMSGTGSQYGEGLGGDYGEPGDASKAPKKVKRVTGNPFVDVLINRANAGCGYVWGASQKGDLCTESYLNRKKKEFGNSGNRYGKARKWLGKQVWDCSSFVCWGLIYIGLKPSSFKRTSGEWANQGKAINVSSDKNMKIGDLMYGGGHIVVYIGNGKVVHASSTDGGCKFGKSSDYRKGSKCKLGCRVSGLDDACRKFLQANPDFYTDSSSNKSENQKDEKKTNLRNSTPLNNNSDDKNNKTYEYSSGVPIIGTFGNKNFTVSLVNGKSVTKNGKNVDKWDNLIIKYCKPYNLDPNFIKTIILIESGGNPNCGKGNST